MDDLTQWLPRDRSSVARHDRAPYRRMNRAPLLEQWLRARRRSRGGPGSSRRVGGGRPRAWRPQCLSVRKRRAGSRHRSRRAACTSRGCVAYRQFDWSAEIATLLRRATPSATGRRDQPDGHWQGTDWVRILGVAEPGHLAVLNRGSWSAWCRSPLTSLAPPINRRVLTPTAPTVRRTSHAHVTAVRRVSHSPVDAPETHTSISSYFYDLHEGDHLVATGRA